MRADIEYAENGAFLDLYLAAPREIAREHGIDVLETAGAACGAVRALSGSSMFNRVMGLELDREATDADLGRIEGFYARVGARYVVAVSRQAERRGLAGRLEERGFTPDYGWAKFLRGVEPPPPVETELVVEEIGLRRAADFGWIVADGYGLPDFVAAWAATVVGRPGWTCFLAFVGDQPAAAAALHVAHGVGWLGFAATLPPFRRLGAQGALLAARIERAAELGCTAVTTETGELVEGRPSDSYRNILRAGFELVYVRPNYLSPAA